MMRNMLIACLVSAAQFCAATDVDEHSPGTGFGDSAAGTSGYSDEMGISEPAAGPANPDIEDDAGFFGSPEPEVNNSLYQCAVTFADGSGLNASMPESTWQVKTAEGLIEVPGAMVRRISKSQGDNRFKMITIVGDQLVGEIKPSKVHAYKVGLSGQEEGIEIELAGVETMAFSTAMVHPSHGSFRWRLRSGEMYVAEAAQNMLILALESGEAVDIPMSAVDSIVVVDDENVSVRTADRSVRIGRPSAESFAVRASCGGSLIELAWSDIETVLRAEQDQKPGTAKPPLRKPSVAPVAVNKKRPVPVFETGLGETRFMDKAIAGITAFAGRDRMLVRTVYGELFLSETMPKDRLREMLKIRPVESNGLVKVVFENPDREVPVGYTAWMLRSGERFYAKLDGESIESCKGMVAMERTDDGRLMWIDAQGGRREVTMSEISLKSPSVGGGCEVNAGSVEAVKPGLLEQLPPLSTVQRIVSVHDLDSVCLPAGEYAMGRGQGEGMDDEIPVHKVSVRAFRIDKCEVTRAQFAEFVDRTGYRTTAEKSGTGATWKSPGFVQTRDDPAVCVSWHDAVEFCNWRSEQSGLEQCYTIDRRRSVSACDRGLNGFRLPTEAEWEYAAKSAGADTVYPWGNDLPTGIVDGSTNQVFPANYAQREDEPQDPWIWTSPVKVRAPNAAGLYDMGGNAWEWCQDSYHRNAYRLVHVHKSDDPCVEESDVGAQPLKVMRGGSFVNNVDMLRCASRGSGAPMASAARVGFRCVRTVVVVEPDDQKREGR